MSGLEKADVGAGHPGRPTSAELQRRKQKIVEVATTLFLRQGYSATTLTEIYKGARVGNRTVSHHIGNKEVIFNLVVRGCVNMDFAPVPTLVTCCSLEDFLDVAANDIVQIVLDPIFSGLIKLSISESSRWPQLTERTFKKLYVRLLRRFAKLTIAARSQGIIIAYDVTKASKVFMTCLIGVLVTENPMLRSGVMLSQTAIYDALKMFTFRIEHS